MARKNRGRKIEGVNLPISDLKHKMPSDYESFFKALKERITSERITSVLSANSRMIVLYWDIGNMILKKQQEEGWGAKVIDRLSNDLREAFPDMTGFSLRNLKYMRKFAASWPDRKIVQRTVAQIPWRSNLTLLDKLNNPEMRHWYAQKTLEYGWSKNILVIQIDNRLHERQGQTINNFDVALPPLESDMASQVFKDPYIFDFLGTDDPRRENELEQKLIDHIERFLLELGQGFAFVGRQVHLEVGDDDFYMDLLFYHLKLRRYVVIELKAGKLQAGHVSQLGMYMTIVDEAMRHPDDKSTIGLLLVKEKNRFVAEYVLAGYTKPISVAEWEKALTKSLPDELKSNLPTVEEIEAELSD